VMAGRPREAIYEDLVAVARKKTAVADTQFGEDGRPIEEENADFGDNVLIVPQGEEPSPPPAESDGFVDESDG
ncbi:MAG: hypothetical protein IKT12_05860, partial [Thermoguttaceae bacterium]|nr:hypothetical protein [Thermoguttaceae bacterium]